MFDPFGGSCVTGRVAEDLGRRWITSELNEEYVHASQYRFFDLPEEDGTQQLSVEEFLSNNKN